MWWLDIASIIGIAIFIFGFRVVLMMGGIAIGGLTAVFYAVFRLARWIFGYIRTRQAA
jgi:cytochrome c biogenesis protein CcdA